MGFEATAPVFNQVMTIRASDHVDALTRLRAFHVAVATPEYVHCRKGRMTRGKQSGKDLGGSGSSRMAIISRNLIGRTQKNAHTPLSSWPVSLPGVELSTARLYVQSVTATAVCSVPQILMFI
jgi:hypothetical protein